MKLMDWGILLESLLTSKRLLRINKCFVSDLNNRKQLVLINRFNFYLVVVKCGVPQCAFLGPLSFLIDINDLHLAIKYSKAHHFADST